MSKNFSANQYDGAFSPHRLGNWEVSRRHPGRPRARSGATRPVVNEKGHLLPGLHKPGDSAWPQGPFTAWEQPKRITRAYAQQMEADASRRLESWLKRSAHFPLPQQEVPPTPPLILPNAPRHASSHASSRRTSARSSKTGKKTTRRSSVASSVSPPQLPESLSEIPRSLPASSRKSSSGSRPHTAPPPPAPSASSNVSQTHGPPLGMNYSDFQIARGLAKESRSHQPLPDTVHDPLFCAMQARRYKEPGLALPSPRSSPRAPGSPARRISSALPPRKVTEMDLAIRWDLHPPGEKKLISGSKVAPAVFNVVAQLGDCGIPGVCNNPPPAPRAAWEERPPTPVPVRSHSAHKHNNHVSEKNPTNNPTHQTNGHAIEKTQKQRQRSSEKHASSPPIIRSCSTPNLNRVRPCNACDQPKPCTAASHQIQNGYKQAFKAGCPNNSRPQTAIPKPLNVPQPRKPFTKRSYSIATLAPPFSLWPDGSRSQDYPDHWRLASVYQHAYKPPELRRKPLLASVFQ